MKILIFCFFIIIVNISCSSDNDKLISNSYKENSNSENKKTRTDSEVITYNDYNFQEGTLTDISYKIYSKKENNGLIILTHKKGSSLEEWTILIDTLLKLNHNIILYDLRSHGYSKSDKNTSFSKMGEDLFSIVSFAKSQHSGTYNHFVFIGNGFGANLSLHNSPKFCNINSSFIILTPELQEEELPIKNFTQYCENSNYLYLYSKKSFEKIITDKKEYITNDKKIETAVDEISNEIGINLLLNNSNFLFLIKNIINVE